MDGRESHVHYYLLLHHHVSTDICSFRKYDPRNNQKRQSLKKLPEATAEIPHDREGAICCWLRGTVPRSVLIKITTVLCSQSQLTDRHGRNAPASISPGVDLHKLFRFFWPQLRTLHAS